MRSILFLAVIVLSGIARADEAPVPANTVSPNGRYGITVPPSFTEENSYTEYNEIIEMKTKRVLGAINNETAFARMNHSDLLPTRWSADSSYALWLVDGKWGMDTLMLIRLKDGEIDWQLDVIKPLQREILTRTEALDPKKFLAAKKANWGDGSAYPEKFTIDARPEGTARENLKFPLRFHVYLTSNPKGAPGVPEIDSSMEATLAADGSIKITGFHAGKSKTSPWNEVQAASEAER